MSPPADSAAGGCVSHVNPLNHHSHLPGRHCVPLTPARPGTSHPI